MKRIISLLLTVSLLAGLCGVLSVNAESPIEEVLITGVTEPVAGQLPTTDGITCNIEGVTVSAYWCVYDHPVAEGESGNVVDIPEGYVFENGKIYQLQITLTSDQAVFENVGSITVNGEESAACWYVEDCAWVTQEYVMDGVTVLDTLNITGIGDTSVGAVMTTANLAAQGAVIFGATWAVDGEYGAYEEGVSVFEDGKSYLLDVYASPAEGYYFGEDMTITFEDQPCYLLWDLSGNTINAGYRVAHGTTEIGWIWLSGRPDDIVPGNIPALNIGIDSNEATMKDAYWVDSSRQNKVTAFADGNAYYLAVELEPKEGYAFGEETSIITDDGYLWDDLEIRDGNCIVYFYYSLLPIAEKVEVTISGVEIGLKPSDVKVTVSGVEAEVDILGICDAATYEEVGDGVFADGKSYMVSFELKSNGSYQFSYQTDLTINGDAYYYYDTNNGITLESWYCFSFLKKIDAVAIAVDEPVIGAAPGEPKLPADANCSIEYQWYDETTGESMEAGDVFQDGHRYMLWISLSSAEGYDFASDAAFTVNGGKPNYSYVQSLYPTTASVEQYWSFADPIEKVELPVMPESIQVGSAPVQIPLVETEQYTIEAYWYDTEDYSEVTVFEDGKVYVLEYVVRAKEGYELLGETQVLMDGKAYTGMWYYGHTYGYAEKYYPLGLEIKDRIDLTVTVPVLGAEPKDPTVPEGADYALYYGDWWENASGNIYDEADETKVFTTGMYHFMSVSIYSKGDYCFSEDTKIYVNGVEAEPIVYWPQGDHVSIVLRYEPLTDSTVDEDAGNTGTQTDSNPQTGDEFPLVAVIVLMVLALAGATVIIIGKKKFAE